MQMNILDSVITMTTEVSLIVGAGFVVSTVKMNYTCLCLYVGLLNFVFQAFYLLH